ncbi:MAG TPA: hypothetical protein VIH79_03530 [Candidatus Nanopelagicaceae bacterium]
MASGLIYLIIIGMWVAYFLPRWIRQHETQSGRETERYKSAMKIVASTPNFPDPVNLDEKLKTLRNRRLILSTLTLALAMSIAGILISLIPAVSVLIPVTALAIYIINVRRQVVAAHIKKRRLEALASISAVEIKVDPSARIDLSERPRLVSELILEQWVPLRERGLSSSITIIRDESERSWSPVAIPRPTYATAPKAITPKRTIDLTTPGKWSAEKERQNALEIPTHEELFDQELAEQSAAARDWAANL